MPSHSGRWGRIPEQRASSCSDKCSQWLEPGLDSTSQSSAFQSSLCTQAKEERIAELETENAVLHLKLAQYRGPAGTRRREGQVQRTRSPLLRVQQEAQRLSQDVRELRSSARELLRSCGDRQRDSLSEVLRAVRSTQLHHEALPSWRARALRVEQSLQEVSERYHRERQRRRWLHNRLVELKGNIRVHCRVRPVLPRDSEPDDPVSLSSSVSGEVAHAVDDETILVRCSRPGHPSVHKTFSFERVYGPAEGQAAVFADVCPLLTSLLDGYNVCIMAYGQTGSGKTHTMLGPHPPGAPLGASGIIPRAAEELFRLIAEGPPERPAVEVSVLEVYNNDIVDLLAKDSGAGTPGIRREVLTAQEGRKEVSPLTCLSVGSAGQLLELVAAGLQRRARRATAVHADSSRSHLVVTVTLVAAASGASAPEPRSSPSLPQEPGCPSPLRPTGRRPRASRPAAPLSPGARPESPARPAEQVRARLQLVDLAGSECAGVSGARGAALREASCINRSLAALADVLQALSEHRDHVPYRNSKLTHLLRDALGGHAKLLVILCVSPGQRHVAETLQSLGFGARARQVERGRPARRPR